MTKKNNTPFNVVFITQIGQKFKRGEKNVS